MEILSLTAKLRASHQKKFVCRFDYGDIHTYSIEAMETMMEKNFPELNNMSNIGSRTSADVKESETELRESESEEETLEIISKKKGEWDNEQSDSESESYHEKEDESGVLSGKSMEGLLVKN